jgi:hypothetical protein
MAKFRMLDQAKANELEQAPGRCISAQDPSRINLMAEDVTDEDVAKSSVSCLTRLLRDGWNQGGLLFEIDVEISGNYEVRIPNLAQCSAHPV